MTMPASMGDYRLADFLGISSSDWRSVLYLPQFRGDARLDQESSGVPPLRYPGMTFSTHDARAAVYLTSLVSRVLGPDSIAIESAGAGLRGLRETAFLVGSRSNVLTLRAAEASQLRELFRFDFGENWSIDFLGNVVSVPDPSRLDMDSYRSHTDYGIIAKTFGPAPQMVSFLLAGLGDHATEGCAYYLTRHWQELSERFGPRQFAALLEFPPPVDPKEFRLLFSAPL